MMPCMHAKEMAQYAADAMEISEPWLRWEYARTDLLWSQMTHHPTWDKHIFYRRKEITININGFNIKGPVRKRPEFGTKYYIPYLGGIEDDYLTLERVWGDSNIDKVLLKKGLVHYSKGNAHIHGAALLSFTTKGETK